MNDSTFRPNSRNTCPYPGCDLPRDDGFGGTCFRHDGRDDLDIEQTIGDEYGASRGRVELPRRPIQAGDYLTYACYGGDPRTIVVIQHFDDIKNGEAGFTGEMANGTSVWGYDHQVIIWPGA